MKAAIYVRTSTKEQHPENQINPCKEFALNRGYEIEGIYIEKLSGYKDITRPEYDKLKAKAHKGEINAVIVWAFDRWVRNRDTLIDDITILRSYGCKLHTVKDAWLEAINIEGPLGKTIQDFLLGMLGSIAQMESQRKSERIKLAVRKKEGERTRSYKGNKWGRKSLPNQTKCKILELHKQGLSIRKISEQVKTYDKHGNAKTISKSVVHKVISSI